MYEISREKERSTKTTVTTTSNIHNFLKSSDD
jgi:hypothetical protein